MDSAIADRRRFLTLFAGAVAAGVTSLAVTAGPAEALPLPAAPQAPPTATTKTMMPEEGIDLSQVERTQYYYAPPRRRLYRRRRRRVVVHRRRPLRYY